jgi:hypothetical protein|tara:strand:- start:3106 stop:3933 length:828 start_codon:yes stop_codon:yes gene_type:complete
MRRDMDACEPSALDDYLFDLRGYLLLEQAIDPGFVGRLNKTIDEVPPLETMEWHGNAQRRDYTPDTGFELHNAFELGGPFLDLIDWPGWIRHTAHYAGEEESYVGGAFVDECVVSARGKSGHHPAHSGGFKGASRGAYRYKDGVFRCGQCNVLLALTDIGPGDGATMVVPGSHKSNFEHPNLGDYGAGDRMDALEGSIEVYMKAGDALLFVDGIAHGGGSRISEGERRVIIMRYGVLWGASRYGFEWSQELLDRVTPEQRRILQPVPPNRPPSES